MMAQSGWLVCGFYTPDYQPWAESLIATLDAHAAPYDIVMRPKLAGGWEVNTMAKAQAVLEAMDRHPDKVIIFLDVDCEVRGDLSPLSELSGDVAFHVQTRRRSSGGVRFRVRSGTLVIKPTTAARRFVETWVVASATSHYGDVDQTTLQLAIGLAPGTSFTPLSPKWCAAPGDVVIDPIIVHDSASRDAPKVSKWQRLFRRMVPRVLTPEPLGASCAGAD